MVTSFYIHWLNGMQLFGGVSWRKLLRNHNPAINQANLGEINLINRSIIVYEKCIERELKACISRSSKPDMFGSDLVHRRLRLCGLCLTLIHVVPSLMLTANKTILFKKKKN